ncbi:hypothetical protein BKA63DRAFT_283371 [Paraphoma chrysanthemicola]|nr:hypothetical protein BKA63DRAFT_283371 [Paraphoma chrysanthemicola]
MSGSRGRGRGGGGPPRGLFENGVWHCDCTPRKPAVHFEVKKEGPNKGKWFRSCQKQQNDKSRCKFFLWDSDAHTREAAALSTNTRTEPGRVDPRTPSKRQPSPPPPYSTESESSRKRTHRAIDIDDDYGLEQSDDAFNSELESAMTAAETPSKAIKTSEFATPTTRRKLPWQVDQPAKSTANGLQTPQTGGRTSNDIFNTRSAAPGGSHITPSRTLDLDDDAHQTATPSSSLETPTPNRFRAIAPEDLVHDVFGLLQDAAVRLAPDTESELKSLLSKHAKTSEGYRRGRDVIRTTVKAKDARITELTYRVSTLEAELEAEKAMVKHLQWESSVQSDP